MSDSAILIDRVSKKFCRSMASTLRYGAADLLRRVFRRRPRATLRRDEFWALDDISTAVARGECLGLVGPNGAGKSTLLKLINRDYRPERGQILTRGRVKSLIRLGSGLQPLLTGRENIYIRCAELGFDKRDTDKRLDEIVAFAELHKALDAPVKHYSDGMYARLEFAIATCVAMDILLIDEVLAVGDIAFQLRCLGRLNELKRQGTAIVFVSHAEMNIRQVADRCLLLFDGRPLVEGPPEAVLYKYYEAVGYLNRQLLPLGLTPDIPDDFAGETAILTLDIADAGRGQELNVRPGQSLACTLEYRMTATNPCPAPALVLQFWNSAGVLVGTVDSRSSGGNLPLKRAGGRLLIQLPFLPLAPGLYRIGGGFVEADRFISYARGLAVLRVTQSDYGGYGGLVTIPANFADLGTKAASFDNRNYS